MDTVLVTGGAGFLGSHLIRHLLHERPQWRVRSFDLLGRQSEPGRLADVIDSPRLEVWQGDVADRYAIRQALRGVRYVFHLAVENSTNPRETRNNTPLRTNLAGTCTLLETAREFSVEGIVYASSPGVLGVSPEPHREVAPARPQGMVPSTRAAGELMAFAFAHEYELPVAVARPSQVYGTWQLPNQIVPWMCWQILQGRAGVITSNVMQQWLHVEDFCAGILAVMEDGEVGGTYHLAGDDEIDGMGMAEMLGKFLGRPVKMELSPKAKSASLLLDGAATERALCWIPEVDLEDGLEQVARWYAEHEGWLRDQWRRLYYSTDR